MRIAQSIISSVLVRVLRFAYLMEEVTMSVKINLIALVFVMTCLGAVTLTQAQVVGQPYRLSDKEVERVLHRIENQANTFRHSLDSALDRSRLNGTNREDDINAFIKNFDEQTKRLHDRFDDHKSVAADVEAVLNRAADINQFMRRQRLSERAQNDWSTLRASLDELAAAYNVTWRWEGVAVLAPPTVITGTTVGLPYRLSDKEVERILHRIEQQSGRFRDSLDSALDRSSLNNSDREDDINAFIKEFDQEVRRLHDRFDEHKSVVADVQTVLDRSARIDDFMNRRRLTQKAQNEWSALRASLDQLAEAYGVTWRW
jgi:DNA mismatch repair ATPase MutS